MNHRRMKCHLKAISVLWTWLVSLLAKAGDSDWVCLGIIKQSECFGHFSLSWLDYFGTILMSYSELEQLTLAPIYLCLHVCNSKNSCYNLLRAYYVSETLENAFVFLLKFQLLGNTEIHRLNGCIPHVHIQTNKHPIE